MDLTIAYHANIGMLEMIAKFITTILTRSRDF